METQKVTASAVKEIKHGKQAGASTGEAQLTPEQEFARILGAIFSGQPLAQANAFDALRSAPQLAVAEPAPVKEQHEPREVEEHVAKDSTEECEHSLGDEEAAPEAEQAKDDDAVKVDEVMVEAVRVDAAASTVESAASSAPSSLPVDQDTVCAGQTAAATPAVETVQEVSPEAAQAAAQAAAAQGTARQTVETPKQAEAQTTQSKAAAQTAQDTQNTTAQEVHEDRDGQSEAELDQASRMEAKSAAQAKAAASTSDFRIGVEPSGAAPSVGGVIPGSERAALASAARADQAALSATQGARVPGQPAAMVQQAGIEAVAGKASVQGSENSAQAFGLNVADETTKKNAPSAAKETAKTAAKTQAQIIEQIQKVLETAAKSKDGNTMVVRLDPPELGTLTVKLTQRADQLFARIIPETPEVEETLRERATEMTQLLAANGFRTENVQISIGMERTASESFHFNLPEQGSRGRQQGAGSERRESADQLPLLDAAAVESTARMLEAGWVA